MWSWRLVLISQNPEAYMFLTTSRERVFYHQIDFPSGFLFDIIFVVIDMFERLISLIGEENLEKIKNAKILLIGIGGVGGFTLEALVRSGFSNITIIDGDTIDVTNLNRQIITNQENIGNLKGNEALKRYTNINPNLKLQVQNVFLTKDNFNQYINKQYDYIIDACDDINIKVELIKYATTNDIKIICSLGTGKKLNSTYLEITTLDKTNYDPLAKKLRNILRKENITLKIPVVFSKEQPVKNEILASAVFVPSVAGIYLANYVFLDIIKPQDNSWGSSILPKR